MVPSVHKVQLFTLREQKDKMNTVKIFYHLLNWEYKL